MLNINIYNMYSDIPALGRGVREVEEGREGGRDGGREGEGAREIGVVKGREGEGERERVGKRERGRGRGIKQSAITAITIKNFVHILYIKLM